MCLFRPFSLCPKTIHPPSSPCSPGVNYAPFAGLCIFLLEVIAPPTTLILLVGTLWSPNHPTKTKKNKNKKNKKPQPPKKKKKQTNKKKKKKKKTKKKTTPTLPHQKKKKKNHKNLQKKKCHPPPHQTPPPPTGLFPIPWVAGPPSPR